MPSHRFPSGVMAKILESLVKNSGMMKDSELFEEVRRDMEISFSDLLKYLMILEMRGYITVASSRENVRVISLTRYGKECLGIAK